MTKMKIGTRGIDAEFNAQRPAQGELLPKLGFANDLGGALLKKRKSFVRLHVGRMQRPERYLFLFNSSRTCSIVSGVARVLNTFWFLPWPGNERLPANWLAVIVLPLSGATRLP